MMPKGSSSFGVEGCGVGCCCCGGGADETEALSPMSNPSRSASCDDGTGGDAGAGDDEAAAASGTALLRCVGGQREMGV